LRAIGRTSVPSISLFRFFLSPSFFFFLSFFPLRGLRDSPPEADPVERNSLIGKRGRQKVARRVRVSVIEEVAMIDSVAAWRVTMQSAGS